MRALQALVKRNIRLFFKDKGMFFSSLITPIILLLLYVTFLADVYRNSLKNSLGEALTVSEKLINGCVGGQLVSSILAVSCITVAFCSNMLMVQDKANGVLRDLTVSPIKPSVCALGYYIASLTATLIVCYTAGTVCLGYLACVGWYLSVSDILLLVLDVFLLSMLGTALSSIVNFFLKTEGQISAVGTIVSAGYGFISGAYMPIASFGSGLQKIIFFWPGTYGTVLLRNHALHGTYEEMARVGFPPEAVTQIKNSIDCNIYFFGHRVEIPVMYAVLAGFAALLCGVYILMNAAKGKRAENI